MASIRLRSSNEQHLQDAVAELRQDLEHSKLDTKLNLSGIIKQRRGDVMSGEAVTWATIVMTAAGTGAVLSIVLSKDDFLSTLAEVLEKYVEGQRVEVVIESKEGKTVVSGPMSEIKAALKQIKD